MLLLVRHTEYYKEPSDLRIWVLLSIMDVCPGFVPGLIVPGLGRNYFQVWNNSYPFHRIVIFREIWGIIPHFQFKGEILSALLL